MRHSEQLPLTAPWIGHVHAAELAAMSALLDAEHGLAALVQQDLLARCAKQPRTGRPGLSGDQVLRMALARQLNGWTYAELAFPVADSASYRTFCRFSSLAPTPSKSALAANLRALRPETLATLNDRLVTSAAARTVEPGRTVRIESTVVPAAIHPPTDSTLLVDGIRVLLRLLRRAEHLAGFTAYHRHLKRAKRRLLAIQHTAPQATRPRRAAYRDLLTLAQATVEYATCALAHVEALAPETTRPLQRLQQQLAYYEPLVRQVIAQTERRVLHGEPVPATAKVVSLFEPHADVLVKDRREDASVGIDNGAVCTSKRALKKRVAMMLEQFEEVLIQEYVPGREFNVGFVGKRRLPIAEIRFDGMPDGTWPIVGYAAKWIPGSPEDEGTVPVCPAEVPDELEASIAKVARDAWEYVSGSEGYGRVDLRVNDEGRPYVLEVNPCPDLSSNAGLARMGRAFGWSYDDLVMHVVDEALTRSQSLSAATALVSGVSAA